MSKLNSFCKEFVAIIKGDDAEVRAQKAWRQCESGLKVQIAALKGDVIAKEDKVENAKEALGLARVNNGQLISDRETYVANLIDAKNRLTKAEKELEQHNAQIAFLEEQYKQLSAE